MTDPANNPSSDEGNADRVEDERGSEVSDYTGEVPRVEGGQPSAGPDAQQPTGYGDGDVADVESIDGHDGDTVDGLPVDEQAADEVAVLTAERDQYRDAAVRLQADFENFRKRSTAQAAADIDRATGRMAEALLPVLDAAESAYINHPDEVGPLFNALLGELRKLGLESVNLDGAPFDPEVAEAVAHEPGDGGEVVVAEVLRSGYTWKGKTLRPAMVRTTD